MVQQTRRQNTNELQKKKKDITQHREEHLISVEKIST
jgi:hypothetical protein